MHLRVETSGTRERNRAPTRQVFYHHLFCPAELAVGDEDSYMDRIKRNKHRHHGSEITAAIIMPVDIDCQSVMAPPIWRPSDQQMDQHWSLEASGIPRRQITRPTTSGALAVLRCKR